MKILLLVDDYLPHSTKIGAKMMHELAIALFENGHQVAVATPDYRVKSKYELDKIDEIDVYRFRSPNVKDESKIKRAINETALSFNAYKNLKSVFKENQFQLIVCYSPSIFFGPLIKKLKKKWNAKSYLILRDLFPQWVIDHGLIKEKSAIASYFRKFEKINYKAADKIGLQSPKNLEWFNEKYGLINKSEVLYNWSSETPIITEDKKYRNKLNLGDKVVLFYGGNMGEAQDMMNLVRLAENLKEENKAHFVFAGSGNEFNLVKKAIAEKDLENVSLLEPVDQEEYRLMLSEFDIGLFTLHKHHSTHNFPGKLLGYMAQGLPILGSVNRGNDVIEVINDAGAGYVSVNGEDNKFSENAWGLIEKKIKRKQMGENSYYLLKNTFSVEAAIRKILN
ncbi:glycosyltransferase family 4 protein [Salegentibacter sp. T436]|uniref:glycosyltransferase family 4 protein n=1 Tax=Salegentibacter sp. T436 TaxID=1729720 RepID=UPI00094A4632|nr:glycosyltransferase family 4 protein [Salegentibacter sp. T436]APS37425.1 glycosyl transferase [Salegentibacter sp. T436]